MEVQLWSDYIKARNSLKARAEILGCQNGQCGEISCFCSSDLQRIESKDGSGGFLKCKTQTCTLFIPEEKYTDLFESYEIKVDSSFKPNNFPLCDCEDVASLWVTHSSKNSERPYFRCQDKSGDSKCDFFHWADNKPKTKRKAASRKCVLKQKQKVQSGKQS